MSQPIKVFIFPFMAHGHLIPALDIAKLFSHRGAETTIITTPYNVPLVSNTMENSKINPNTQKIKTITIKFPYAEVGLPEGFDSVDSMTSSALPPSPDIVNRFFKATTMLQPQLEKLLEEIRPDCLVADVFFPWSNESSDKFGIPCLVFHGTSFFSQCTTECLRAYEPHKKVSLDSEPFIVTNLPGDIELTRDQLADTFKSSGKEEEESEIMRIFRESAQEIGKCFGVIFNSFYELEDVYADYYRNDLKRRAWHIGPVSLCNQGFEEKADRGKKSSLDQHECLKWLDLKEPESVIYICFGSVANFTNAQLMEIAKGLEASGQNFIWVVRKVRKVNQEDKEEWLPDGFEKRMKDKGMIIRGWAPQVLLLEHQAVGGFVTHCGWNSTLEGISAGLPMVTWPVSAEQFYNEKLVTKVLKTGVGVGAQKWAMVVGDFVTSDKIEKAVREVMVGDEAGERRKRAKEFGEMARKAVNDGGSSYKDLDNLIQELKSLRDN